MADVPEVRFKRRAIRHGEQAVVALLLAGTLLLDFKDTDGPASEHLTRVGLRVVNDQHIERISVLSFGRGYEAPIIRITQSSH